MAKRNSQSGDARTPTGSPPPADELLPPSAMPAESGAPPAARTNRSLPRAKPLPASADSRLKKKDGIPGQSRKSTTVARRRRQATVEIEAEETDPLAEEDLAETAIKTAPAWLVSMLFHTVLIIVLALIYVGRDLPQIIALDATYAETLGEQLDDDTLQAASLDPVDVKDPAYALDENPVDDPLAAPPDIEPQLMGLHPTDTIKALTIGVALTGREKGMKKALLLKYGGTAKTEAAVIRALEWLKRNQRRDGAWSLTGPYTSGAFDDNKTAATAMALLAFQGAGHTHQTGRFKETVEKGWRALLKMQDRDGNFFRSGVADQRLYSQAQAMIAVCEIYGMTKDSMFKKPAQKAVDYAVKIQAKEGGWRYQPGQDADTSVTGWFVMGLQSALMAGLDVPSPTLKRISSYLDSVAMYGGSYYKYHPIRKGFTPAMTAEGLLCRQYLGWTRTDPRLIEGVDMLLENPVDWDDRDVYYWYYATQVCHHMEGDAWERWNQVMREVLPKNQIMTGQEKGSWDPDGDRWGNHGGRLYTTCLSVYMLEVYYRHLPIYSYRLQ